MTATQRLGFAARQARLQQAIVAPRDRAASEHVHALLQSTAALDAQARLAIYQRSYRARLLEAFHAIFPTLLHAIGTDALNLFALDFLTRHPPRTHSVGRIADGFADHLHATRPPPTGDEAGWEYFAVDLARLELAVLHASEAPGLENAPAANPTDLREWDETQLLRARPRRAPCVQLIDCSHPVHRYWYARRDGEEPTQPPRQRTWLALTRIDYRLSVRELAQVQWEMLTRFDGMRSMGDALAEIGAIASRPKADATLARVWLGNFVAQGLVYPVLSVA